MTVVAIVVLGVVSFVLGYRAAVANCQDELRAHARRLSEDAVRAIAAGLADPNRSYSAAMDAAMRAAEKGEK